MQAGDPIEQPSNARVSGIIIASQEEETPQFSGGVLRKKLYDQNLSDWSARYRKNKTNLDALTKDCDLLRVEVGKSQREVDERKECYNQLEDQYENVVLAKYHEVKAAYEGAKDEKAMLQGQISKNRKDKSLLTRERKMLTNDYERKHAELLRMAEVHDKLDGQLAHLTQQLGQLTSDRRRMERELDEVQHNLRANTCLADEVNCEISHVQDGIKDSMDLHMAPAERFLNASAASMPISNFPANDPEGEP